jgi:hypothetical protein
LKQKFFYGQTTTAERLMCVARKGDPSFGFRYAQTMATGTPLLTLEEFQRRYAGQDTVYEYWLGEAVPRVGHTTLHGVTQKVVARLLDELAYWTSVGVDLQISSQWRPKPMCSSPPKPSKNPSPPGRTTCS